MFWRIWRISWRVNILSFICGVVLSCKNIHWPPLAKILFNIKCWGCYAKYLTQFCIKFCFLTFSYIYIPLIKEFSFSIFKARQPTRGRKQHTKNIMNFPKIYRPINKVPMTDKHFDNFTASGDRCQQIFWRWSNMNWCWLFSGVGTYGNFSLMEGHASFWAERKLLPLY